MANNVRNPLVVTIPEAVTEDGITVYQISVQVGEVNWDVPHRYREFQQMHEQLVEEGVAGRDLLPPKKLIGSKEPAFIMKRRRELELYLQEICHFLERNLPSSLAKFLGLDQYDLHHVVQQLAELTHDQPDLAAVSWDPLQMFSITERLQTPCPPQDMEDKRFDFTNVADTCCRLPQLTITGSKDKLGTSNIIPNELSFDFLAFKSLTVLHLESLDVSPLKISSLGVLRSTIVSLACTHCGLNTVSQLLLCDTVHSVQDLPSLIEDNIAVGFSWPALTSLNLSNNSLTTIDCSVRLASKSLTKLDLSFNAITEIQHLTGLPNLSSISVSNNKLKDISSLHTKLGQISQLDLSSNSIRTLEGLARLYSVTSLDVSNNKLRTLADVSTAGSLPCLDSLIISPNKVNNEVDYRLKVLEGFGGRCGDLRLDDLRTSQAEMDKVSVLMALSVAREGKNPTTLFGNLPGGNFGM